MAANWADPANVVADITIAAAEPIPAARARTPHHTWQMDASEHLALADGSEVSWLRVVDEATGAVVTHQRSLAPRAGYNPGDPILSVITCQL